MTESAEDSLTQFLPANGSRGQALGVASVVLALVGLGGGGFQLAGVKDELKANREEVRALRQDQSNQATAVALARAVADGAAQRVSSFETDLRRLEREVAELHGRK